MGNEASRSSRHSNGSSPLRRSSRRSSKSKSTALNGGQNYIAEDEMDRNTQELTQTPKPVKRMEKIRRSLSFRRKKKSDKQGSRQLQQPSTDQNSANLTSSVSAPVNILNNNSSSSASASVSKSNSTTTQALANNHNTNTPTTPINNSATNNLNETTSTAPVVVKPPHWIEDEKRVRAGNCSFQVKYLGSNEVSDSRGMHLCEMAIEKLLSEKEKKKPIKAILYVSGDSLRVVDEANKTLLVDQTIEKVSFCAPDRHHENGFAYICRDGTTRRWLCHCFMATKDTLKNSSTTGSSGTGCSGGERLSHAVGCAFSVCLEKKQKRERENVTMEVGPNHSFTRMGSFRQASLTERLEDPQIVMPANDPVPLKPVENPHAIERPRANPDAFTRQNSLRGSGVLQLPFKRNSAAYTSLKPGELPSFQQQKLTSGFSNTPGTNNNTTPLTKTSLLMQQHQINQNNNSSTTIVSPSQTINQIATPTSSAEATLLTKRINTISELPEEHFSLNSNEINSSKLNEQLNVQTNENYSHFNTPITPSTNNGWPNNNNFNIKQQQPQQANFFQINSSVLTPQSNPVTPSPNNISSSPPPLPPMPNQYTTPIAMYQTQSHLPLNLQQQQQQYLYQQQLQQQMYQNNITPLVQMMPMMNIQAQPSIYTTPQPLVSSMASPSSSSVTNETFEQKWARIQAAKKTNPFAEDIAKKFEIKL